MLARGDKPPDTERTRNARETSRTKYFLPLLFVLSTIQVIFTKAPLTVDKQPAKEHNSIQYTHDMNNAGRNYGVPFSTLTSYRRHLLAEGIIARSTAGVVQPEVIEQDREWLEVMIDRNLEAFGRIKSSRYRSIRSHLLSVLQGDSSETGLTTSKAYLGPITSYTVYLAELY